MKAKRTKSIASQNPLNPQNRPSLDERYAHRPRVRQRLMSIADMMDQAVAEGCTADEAERRAIEQLRQLGNELLSGWAEEAEPRARQAAQAENPQLIDYGKKKS